MDHSYPAPLPFHPLPSEITSTGARIVSFLHSGGRAVVLVGARESGKTSTLDAVLAGMPAWVERVSNRIPQPLTLARILAQVGAHGGPCMEPEPDCDLAATLLRTLAERSSAAQPAVLAIDDAHTLTPDALAALAQVPGAGGPDQPGMMLLLAGEPGLVGLLRGAGLGRLRGAATLALQMPPRPGAAAASGPGLVADVSRRWPYMAMAVGVTLLAAALMMRPAAGPVLVSVRESVPGRVSGSVPESVPGPPAMVRLAPLSAADQPPAVREPEAAGPPAVAVEPMPASETAPQASVPAEAAPEQAAPKPASVKPPPTEVQLRRDFDIFLNRAGRDTAQLTAPAREALFREYMQWRSRAVP